MLATMSDPHSPASGHDPVPRPDHHQDHDHDHEHSHGSDSGALSPRAASEAIARLLHPQHVSALIAVATAALIGFAGNELVAGYRIRTGRKIGSAALVADGLHARTDGLTSLAVLIGAGGVALGWNWADPVIGLVITVAILAVLRQAAREIYRRLTH